jgi:putative PIN family toxin of toxin-antitoxin system
LGDQRQRKGDGAIAGDGTPAARIRIRATPANASAIPVRLVLDTNVWLDWLVFEDPDVAPLKAAVTAGRAAVFVDEASEAELARVLAYPFGNKTLTVEAQAACLAECRRIARSVDGERVNGKPWSLPLCSDPDDQKFLDLALSCGAAFLVTRDRDLLELSRHRDPVPPFRIVTPRQFQGVIGDK